MNFMYGYIQSRWKELPIWCGIPIIGLLASGKDFPLWVLFVFGLAVVFSAMHILMFNDWAGLEKNPHEMLRYEFASNRSDLKTSLFQMSFISYMIALVLFFCLKKALGFIVLGGLVVNILYVHPKWHWKEYKVPGSLLHFLGGEIQFLLGYMLGPSSMMTGFLWGAFFSMILVSGHFVHTCMHWEEDKKGGIHSWATSLTVLTVMRTAVVAFCITHFYLVLLIWNDVISFTIGVLFFWPVIVHVWMGLDLLYNRNIHHQTIMKYRQNYRISYGIATLIFIWIRLF